MKIKKILTFVFCLLLPSFMLRLTLRLLGHSIGKNVKIGFNLIITDKLELGDNVKISNLNLILIPKIMLANNAKLGYLNICKGPFDLILSNNAALGNKNYLTRGPLGLTYGKSVLKLGELTKITTGHHLDLTKSIIFGDFSILAGIGSQIWTHGYYHASNGKDRIRIDGSINIGDNVYIGSGSIFNPGVKVGKAIHLGAGSVISKNLEKPGMYVGHSLRFIYNDIDTIKNKLEKINNYDLIESVYKKSNGAKE